MFLIIKKCGQNQELHLAPIPLVPDFVPQNKVADGALAQEKTIDGAPTFALNQEKSVVQFLETRRVSFDIELPKQKDQLEVIHHCVLLGVVSMNTSTNHVFSNLQNCSITINYIVDPKALPAVVPSSSKASWTRQSLDCNLQTLIQDDCRLQFVGVCLNN